MNLTLTTSDLIPRSFGAIRLGLRAHDRCASLRFHFLPHLFGLFDSFLVWLLTILAILVELSDFGLIQRFLWITFGLGPSGSWAGTAFLSWTRDKNIFHWLNSAILAEFCDLGWIQQFWLNSAILVEFSDLGRVQRFWLNSAILDEFSIFGWI